MHRLIREMGIQAIYPKPDLSKPHSEHKKYSYLLRDSEIEYPDIYINGYEIVKDCIKGVNN